VLSPPQNVHASPLSRADEQREKIIPGCGNGQRRCGIWNISDPGPATVYPALRLWHQSEDFIKVDVHRARQWANSNTSRKSYCGEHDGQGTERPNNPDGMGTAVLPGFTGENHTFPNLFACMHVFFQWKFQVSTPCGTAWYYILLYFCELALFEFLLEDLSLRTHSLLNRGFPI